jgi:hypothetical protein
MKNLCQKSVFESDQKMIDFGVTNFLVVVDFFDKSDNTESVYFYDPKRLHYYIITFFKGSRTLPPKIGVPPLPPGGGTSKGSPKGWPFFGYTFFTPVVEGTFRPLVQMGVLFVPFWVGTLPPEGGTFW